jgi:hypothetical protein
MKKWLYSLIGSILIIGALAVWFAEVTQFKTEVLFPYVVLAIIAGIVILSYGVFQVPKKAVDKL